MFAATDGDIPLLPKEMWQAVSDDLTGSFQATLFRYAILKVLYTQGVDSLSMSDIKKYTRKDSFC